MKQSFLLRLQAGVFLACGAAFALSSCGHGPKWDPEKSLPMVTVQVMTVENIPHPSTEDVVGTVRPKLRARIEARISARIEQLVVVPGQAVKLGENLAILDAREIQARLEQARAVLAQANKDFQRLQPLLQSNAISRQDYDAAEAKQRVAQSAVSEADTMLTHTKIIAPFDGIITRKLADVGDLAMPGKPLLEIESPTTLRFEADVPEALIERVKLNLTLPVTLNALAKPITGTVAEIAPIADPGSRTYLVKLDLPQVTGIRAGQFGRVKVTVGDSDVPLVPVSAIKQRGQMELVQLVTDGRVQSRIVKTGKSLDGQVEVISGLEGGETLITQSSAALKDGQPVEAKP
jgi:RND family efflux transporter MFP subunit